MQRYRALHGESGVLAYHLKPQAIVVRFQNGTTYEYTDASAGAATIATMKRLAAQGRGLSTFISRHVRDAYARKLH